jgi:hypothetical protein
MGRERRRGDREGERDRDEMEKGERERAIKSVYLILKKIQKIEYDFFVWIFCIFAAMLTEEPSLRMSLLRNCTIRCHIINSESEYGCKS